MSSTVDPTLDAGSLDRPSRDRSADPAVTLATCQSGARPNLIAILGLFVLIALAALLRIHGLDREGFWGDEYISLRFYALPIKYLLYHALTGHAIGPIDGIVGWIVQRVYPAAWAFRILSAVSGVVAVGACYFLVKRLASWREGLVAAAILCVCRQNVIISQENRGYSLTVALIVVALVLMLRAIERPTIMRIGAYASVLVAGAATRFSAPVAYQLSLGIALSVALLFSWTRRKSAGSESARALRRVWIGTVLAGLATMPLLALMMYAVRQFTVLSGGFQENIWGTQQYFTSKLSANVLLLLNAQLDSFGPWVMVLCALGIGCCLWRWSRSSLGTKCAISAMLFAGPIFVVTCSVMLRYHPLTGRYSYHLMPTIAAFAAIGGVAVARWVSNIAGNRSVVGYVGIVALFASILAYPAVMCAGEFGSYRRRDWRGCARLLADRVAEQDVILLLNERPFGKSQPTFHAKYDWPVAGRPLAEAIWTLATSNSHFERMVKRSGRCFVFLSYDVLPQSEHAYLSSGLSQAPSGYELTKLRGLDLLVSTDPSGSLLQDIVSSCDDMLELPRAHESTNVILLTLKARTLLRLNRKQEARRAYQQARESVPPDKLFLFDHHTASWSADLLED